MLISEYLALRSQISVTTGNGTGAVSNNISSTSDVQKEGESFADALRSKIEEKRGGVEFSKHAMKRLEERSIDLNAGNTLERLN